MVKLSRREFFKKTAVLGAMSPFIPYKISSMVNPGELLELHVFSKHLQFLGYDDMAKAAADIGFEGIDLAVRPGGHVIPDQVTRDLPRASEAVRNAGLKCSMMTTSVENAGNEVDRTVLKTASESGFRFYRMNWLSYDDDYSMTDSIARMQDVVRELSELNASLGLTGCYQNHAGKRIGAAIWEVKQLLSNADPRYMGAQYDIRHAMVEGAMSWENGLRLIHPHIKTIALKDYKWGKIDGRWQIVNTPIGEGMVDFKRYFQLMKRYEIHVPVSLHFEYPLGGAEHGRSSLTIDKKVVYDAMISDVRTVRELWKSA